MTPPTEPARAAAYRAIVRRATETSEIWGSSIYPDIAPGGESHPRPYLVYFWSGGGELNASPAPDAELLVAIKGVSDTMAQAFAMAGRIGVLFNDTGKNRTTTLSPGGQWTVVSCTQERDLHVVESIGGKQVYSAGAYFRLRLASV